MSAEVKFDASGLGQEWDVVEVLRERMRGGQCLLLGSLHEFTVQRACKNIDVLAPVLVRCAAANLKTPEVECLRTEIQSFYQMHQRAESEETIDDLAWEVRKLLSFVKRKTQRKEVSTAPGFNLIEDFQEMCLILNPHLQDVVDAIRRRFEDPPQEDEDEDDDPAPVADRLDELTPEQKCLKLETQKLRAEKKKASIAREKETFVEHRPVPERISFGGDSDDTVPTNILDCPTPAHVGSTESLASFVDPAASPTAAADLREKYQHPERGAGPSTLPLMGTVPEPPIPSADEPAEAPAPSEPSPAEDILLRRDQLGLRSEKKNVNREAKANGKKRLLRAKSGLKQKTKQPRGASIKVWPANRRDEWDEGMTGRWYTDEWGNEWWDEEGEPSYYWDDSGCYEYAGEWAANDDGLAEPALSRRKRGKQAETERASSSKGPEKPKPKAKVAAKAKSKAKAKAKGKPSAKAPAADRDEERAEDDGEKPTRKKSKVAKNAAGATVATAESAEKKPQVRKDHADVEPLREWVSRIDLDAEASTFKTQVRAFLPTLKGGTRLNIYWTRFSCGVTLYYKEADGSSAKTDVGFFKFSKCNAGLCYAVACARFMAAEQLDDLAITDPEDELILEIKDKWKCAGASAWAEFNDDA
ncbi:unnamed protein product [Symbiodinium necroappetens]|uniref:Uncharacterized protein n=1 Tax=Symbiodinium necroappetens TaxID=1628268 RepID=A0A812S132_9DINO|nr:unnamed protein product [Symbiodinium necroappetens]